MLKASGNFILGYFLFSLIFGTNYSFVAEKNKEEKEKKYIQDLNKAYKGKSTPPVDLWYVANFQSLGMRRNWYRL